MRIEYVVVGEWLGEIDHDAKDPEPSPIGKIADILDDAAKWQKHTRVAAGREPHPATMAGGARS